MLGESLDGQGAARRRPGPDRPRDGAAGRGVRRARRRSPGGTPTCAGLLGAADVVEPPRARSPTQTRHLIDARRSRRCGRRPSSSTPPAARSSTSGALVDALRDGTIAGAALDVYEREPEVEEGLLALENVVLTPHLGSATRETRVAMGMLCVDALRAVLLEGRRPANAVG